MEIRPGISDQHLKCFVLQGVYLRETGRAHFRYSGTPPVFLKHLLNHPPIGPPESPKNLPYPYKTPNHGDIWKIARQNIGGPVTTNSNFREAITSTQPTIYPKLPLPYAPTRVFPCTKSALPTRVRTAPRGPFIIPPNNDPTGTAFITKEEEEMDTRSPPRQYPTCNWTVPQNYKYLTVNTLINPELNLANHIVQIQDQNDQSITPLNPASKSHMATGFSYVIIDPKTLEYRQIIHSEKHKHVWTQFIANTFDRLVQGIRGHIKVTDCIHFIRYTRVPKRQNRLWEICDKITPT